MLSQLLQVISTFIIIEYYYPALSDEDLGWIRIGGPGLASCMFLATNAYISSVRGDGKLITPTWCKFSLGPILRREHDKRVYNQLFNDISIKGMRRAWITLTKKVFNRKDVEVYHTLGGFFQDLNKDVVLA